MGLTRDRPGSTRKKAAGTVLNATVFQCHFDNLISVPYRRQKNIWSYVGCDERLFPKITLYEQGYTIQFLNLSEVFRQTKPRVDVDFVHTLLPKLLIANRHLGLMNINSNQESITPFYQSNLEAKFYVFQEQLEKNRRDHDGANQVCEESVTMSNDGSEE